MVLGQDRLQLKKAFRAQARLIDTAQHPADVRHGKAFGVVGVNTQTFGQCVGRADIAQGFAEFRIAAFYELAAIGCQGSEVIHVQLGALVAQAGGDGQLVDATELCLQVRRSALIFCGRHPGAAGLYQLLPGFVLQ